VIKMKDSEPFIYGDDCISIKDYDFELDDYKHEEHGTSRIYSETTYIWKGTVKTTIGDIKFEINDFSSTENGGVGIKILPKKPKELTKEQWQEFECWLQNSIEENYNRREWLESVRQ